MKSAVILIIDDNESDALLMEEAIKEAMRAKSIHTVHKAEDAIKFLNKQAPFSGAPRPDLILLDLKMPNFDGHEFLKVVKTDPKLLSIPVIALTSSKEQDLIEESYRLHANCHVVKPMNFMKFKKIVSVINDFWLTIAALPEQNDD